MLSFHICKMETKWLNNNVKYFEWSWHVFRIEEMLALVMAVRAERVDSVENQIAKIKHSLY